ncbi:MAG: putative toxin-antitoxin system toxin component, PIN family [Candidatus Wallbacteria bacterium]|nr:putative toxin-antitoxin system toxin component, PIN family [Candidatus Wallbacteria bacterium]
MLDSKVVVSAFLVASGPSARILTGVRDGHLTWVLSPTILREVEKTLALPRISKRYGVDPGAVAFLIASLGELAVQVQGVVLVERKSRDPKDDPILACAVDGNVEYLVTGDQDLLTLRPYEGIAILTPREFLAILESRRR